MTVTQKFFLALCQFRSILSSASRESLYRHFDKLDKNEQIAVLRDAISKRDRLEQLDRMSDKFDDKELAGLSIKEKASHPRTPHHCPASS